VKYRDIGIPDEYRYDEFLYVPAANAGVAVFVRNEEPQVSRIFWRQSEDDNYVMIPVSEPDYSLDSCRPSLGSKSIYYIVTQRRKPEGHKGYGGYWISLNKFSLDTQLETTLVDKDSLGEMTGASGSWISRILSISPDDSEIDVVAAIREPTKNGWAEMKYGVYRIAFESKRIALRLKMPAVFI